MGDLGLGSMSNNMKLFWLFWQMFEYLIINYFFLKFSHQERHNFYVITADNEPYVDMWSS